MTTPSANRRAMLARRAPVIALLLNVHAFAAATSHPDQLAWRLFVAINKPAGYAESGAAAPVAWETWPNTQVIYRSDGADPGPWRTRSTAAGSASEARFERLGTMSPELTALANVKHIVAGHMVPGLPRARDAQRLIESRMNPIAFAYVRSHALYNLDGQMRAVASGRALDFPRGSIEVKASWRPIEASDAPRYRTLWVHFAGGETRLYGLTALNMAAKILPPNISATPSPSPGTVERDATRGSPWLWASFEHVDNAHRADGEGWLLPSHDDFACPRTPSNCDEVPAGLGLEATIWQNYRLRGTLTAYVDADGHARRLGNSELEAGLQSTASCITCHARSALAVVGGRGRRLPVFATNERRGSIGMPDPAWFRTDGVVYRSLDFVWSLAQAKPSRTAARTRGRRHESPVEDLGDSR